VDAFVGVKFDEAQVLPNSRMGEEGGHSGDFQWMSPWADMQYPDKSRTLSGY
jgi:hypothetical protein